MRTLAIGDIHGCAAALKLLEAFVPFKPDDLIITLGDYIDRGPDSKGVLDWLIDREQTGLLVPLRGNHEIMMLDARFELEAFEDWKTHGGKQTLASWPLDEARPWAEQIDEKYWRFISGSLLDMYEQEETFYVHANVICDMPLNQQASMILFWEPLLHAQPHVSGKRMICGHTPQLKGVPRNWGHTVCIDTAAWKKDGWLTCLDVETGEYWQASQAGKTRRSMLKRPR